MMNFFKGVIVGIGGITPGLSGSVLLVILGLYEKVINSIGTLFKDFKKNISFLAPLFMGFGVGVIIFSKIVNYLLNNFEVYTRFAFLGLVTGTIPLFYKEVNVMDWAAVLSFIQGVGFPIACVLIMFQQMEKERDAHKEEMRSMTEALNNNTQILTALKQKLEDLDNHED